MILDSESVTPILDFFVLGRPAPGGSKSAFVPRRKDGSIVCRAGTNQPVVNITDAGKGNKEWRKIVAMTARAVLPMSFKLIEGREIGCQFDFWLPRPQAEFTSAGQLKNWAQQFHRSKPDVLKLARSTEDALTSIVWKDDCLVTKQMNTKRYCGPGDQPGCRIRIVLL